MKRKKRPEISNYDMIIYTAKTLYIVGQMIRMKFLSRNGARNYYDIKDNDLWLKKVHESIPESINLGYNELLWSSRQAVKISKKYKSILSKWVGEFVEKVCTEGKQETEECSECLLRSNCFSFQTQEHQNASGGNNENVQM